MRSGRWAWAAGLLFVVMLVVGIAVQLTYVHAKTGEWTLSMSSAQAPTRIHFQGRDYDRGGRIHLPRSAVKSGTTAGGGVIYVRRGEVGTPLGVVVAADDRMWGYGLVGGP
jgi:hypothetical protein